VSHPARSSINSRLCEYCCACHAATLGVAYLVNDGVTGSGMSSSSSSQEIGGGDDDDDQERINPPGSEGKHFSIFFLLCLAID